MDTEKKPALPAWWQCAAAGGVAGILPVAGMLVIHFFAGASDGLYQPGFAPDAAVYLCGWGITAVCSAVSVALQWPRFKKWAMPVWTTRIAQALLIPAWAACLTRMPGLSFALLAALLLCAAANIRFPHIGGAKGTKPMAAALLACPLFLWGLYAASVLYMSLMITP